MKDFDVLYQNTPGHIRSNANLPGHFVFAVSSLEMEADDVEQERAMLEKAYPGYDAEHKHVDCGDDCRVWNWRDYGIPEEYNPLKVFIEPYLQISRAEGMKGSEQVVRGFNSQNQPMMEGLGTPSLQPRMGPSPVVVIQNGVKEVKRGPRLGLGR